MMGTDAGGFPWTDPDLNEAREFHYYVDYGMTPMQAIRSATTVSSRDAWLERPLRND